jgi:hypothetical protein
MPCSICFQSDHNKRTCSFRSLPPARDIPTVSEVRVARVLGEILSPTLNCRSCSLCGERGHNKRTCPLQEKKTDKSVRRCSLCGANGHNKRTCPLTCVERRVTKNSHRKCNICGESGHNKRTCPMKCVPCSDQVARAYCFSGMSDKKAVKMAKILDCSSIYGETEEYSQPTREKETITFANGETIHLDLGPS